MCESELVLCAEMILLPLYNIRTYLHIYICGYDMISVKDDSKERASRNRQARPTCQQQMLRRSATPCPFAVVHAGGGTAEGFDPKVFGFSHLTTIKIIKDIHFEIHFDLILTSFGISIDCQGFRRAAEGPVQSWSQDFGRFEQRGHYAKPRRGASGKRLELRLEALSVLFQFSFNSFNEALESFLEDVDIVPTRLPKKGVSLQQS